MACRTPKYALLRSISKGYATKPATSAECAKPASSPSSAPVEVKTICLPSKLAVASVENHSPVSRVSVLFRAGSRNETADNRGITHLLRIAAGLKTSNVSQFLLIRNLQQVGASLSCTTGREHVAYTVECTRNQVETALKFLAEASCKQLFKPWEIKDNLPRMKLELATIDPQVKAIELLHQAAYRTGLGNSLYCPSHLVGSHSSEDLQHYTGRFFTSNRGAVVGVGVDHDLLVNFAECMDLKSGTTAEPPAATYYGGEVRVEANTELAYIAVAAEGGSLKNSKEALAFTILQSALGFGPLVKWGNIASSPLYKAAAQATTEPFGLSALNISYTDSGLFGFTVAGDPCGAAKAAVAAAKALKSVKLSEEDIAGAKNRLKAAALMSQESSAEMLDDLGAQAVLLNSVFPADRFSMAIDQVPSSDVNAALKKVASGNLSMGAYGNIVFTPYLDGLE